MRAAADTAICYDFMLVPGGAERLTLHLLKQHPDWPLFTAFADRQAFEPGVLPPGRIHELTGLSRRQGWQALKALNAFERQGALLNPFERVLFSGVYAPAAAASRPQGKNFYYCHTPPRFAYDLADYYRAQAAPWQRAPLAWLVRRVRRRFEAAMGRMQRIAANSVTVRERLQRHLGLENVAVIHPPVATDQWRWLGQEDFFLSNARLEPYKRVEPIVRAFMALPGEQLIVTSGGSEAQRLRQLAADHDNIRFTGWCDDATLRELTGRCRATLYLAKDEDFGLSPVESMAAGKPVIGAREGGLRETVLEGETGILLSPEALDTPEPLIEAIRSLSANRARRMRTACERRAESFGAARFDREIARFLGDSHDDTPPLEQ